MMKINLCFHFNPVQRYKEICSKECFYKEFFSNNLSAITFYIKIKFSFFKISKIHFALSWRKIFLFQNKWNLNRNATKKKKKKNVFGT
jgi:hypothetical protein